MFIDKQDQIKAKLHKNCKNNTVCMFLQSCSCNFSMLSFCCLPFSSISDSLFLVRRTNLCIFWTNLCTRFVFIQIAHVLRYRKNTYNNKSTTFYHFVTFLCFINLLCTLSLVYVYKIKMPRGQVDVHQKSEECLI